MTGPVSALPAGQRSRDDLAARFFRALYQRFDLHQVSGTYIAIPKGTPCFAASSLGDIARQISAASAPAPDPAHRGTPRQTGTST